jgi:site-specific DNA recombinase
MDGNGHKRAVLYARTSYDDRGNEDRNLKGQLELCRSFALDNGYQVVAEVSEDDKGASGASFELEGLNSILEMAEAGAFDVLVVRELDRLSRKLAKQLVVEEELKRAKVAVEYCLATYDDTPEGNLNKNIRASFAEYEREKIRERTTRARRHKVKAGSVLVGGKPPYGYRVIEDGNRFALTVCESEAQIVRLIYLWYVYGDGESGPLSILAITRKLDGVPSYADSHGGRKVREQGKWNASTVHQMLKNETYAGVWRFGKRHRSDDGRWINNPAEHVLTVEVPALVDRETWQAAQGRLGQNKAEARRNRRYNYLLSRRVTCGACGLKMAGNVSWYWYKGERRTYSFYRCPTERGAGYERNCDTPAFRADQVDAAVWDWVRSFLSDPAALVRGLGQYQAEREKENAPLWARLNVLNDLIADNEAQLGRLLDLYLSGDFPKEVLTDRKTRLETTIRALEGERTDLVAHLKARTLTPDQIQSLQAFAAKVGRGLDLAEADFDTRRRIIEELNVRATLTIEDGQRVIYASCILDPKGVCIAPNTTQRTNSRICPLRV